MKGRDVWVIDLRQKPGFALEALLPLFVAREPRVAGPVDFTHTALTDGFFDRVVTDTLAALETHWAPIVSSSCDQFRTTWIRSGQSLARSIIKKRWSSSETS